MKELTLFKAIEKVLKVLNGEEVSITSVDAEPIEEAKTDIRALGLQIAYRNADAPLLTMSDVAVKTAAADNNELNLLSIQSLRSYFKCKIFTQETASNTNSIISDEFISIPWNDMPDSVYNALSTPDCPLLLIDYSGLTYLDYTPMYGALCYTDEVTHVMYLIGFDVEAFHSKEILEDINLQPFTKLGIPLVVEYTVESGDADEFAVMCINDVISAVPAIDTAGPDTDMALINVSSQSNGISNGDDTGYINCLCIPDLDLNKAAYTYKYVINDQEDSTPQLAP